MKIALLAPGSSVHAVRWANAFVARGHTVHLITQHAPTHGLDAAVEVILLHHLSGVGYLLNGPRLGRTLRAIRPDVVNAHYATGYGTLARGVGEVPLVLNVWGSDVYDFPEKSPLHRWWLQGNLRRADALVSTSEVMADRTRELVPELPRPMVVPFGVDLELFRPGASKEPPQKTLVVGTVKTLAPKYGIDQLVRAFARTASQTEQKVELRIVGDGPQKQELQALVRSLGVADRVRFMDRVPHDQVPQVLAGFDLYAALSQLDSESFGVAVIEASACGLAVVVSDVGGLPEVVEDGVTGFVVPRNDPGAAAEKLALLLGSEELRRRMGQAGRERVTAKYEWGHCVDRMLKVLESATSGAKGPADA